MFRHPAWQYVGTVAAQTLPQRSDLSRQEVLPVWMCHPVHEHEGKQRGRRGLMGITAILLQNLKVIALLCLFPAALGGVPRAEVLGEGIYGHSRLEALLSAGRGVMCVCSPPNM